MAGQSRSSLRLVRPFKAAIQGSTGSLGENEWLASLMDVVPQRTVETMVAHRGWHNKCDDLSRPLENTLAAYEIAWGAGIKYCECDIAVTNEKKLVLCHDNTFSRLALNPATPDASKLLGDLTMKDLHKLRLKDGSRAPELEDLLVSAQISGDHAKLVVEIKYNNAFAAVPLCELFTRRPELVESVAVVMSFDHRVIRTFANKYKEEIRDKQVPVASHPKLLLLTCRPGDGLPHEVEWSIDWDLPVQTANTWIRGTDGEAQLDGIYVQYEPGMLGPKGGATVTELCEENIVGVWGSKKDPDTYDVLEQLRNLGPTFVNTDLPRSFVSEQLVDDDGDDGAGNGGSTSAGGSGGAGAGTAGAGSDGGGDAVVVTEVVPKL